MMKLFLSLILVLGTSNLMAADKAIEEKTNLNSEGAAFNIDSNPIPSGCACNATFSGSLLENTAKPEYVQAKAPAKEDTSR